MNDHDDRPVGTLETTQPPSDEVAAAAAAATAGAANTRDSAVGTPAESNGGAGPEPAGANGRHGENWRTEAGRKGGRRVHQLIRHGLLYEQEHGLKRGRQRLRQLVQEGKLYEQEHGLRPVPAGRGSSPRLGSDQVLRSLFHVLQRLVKPAYREKLARALQALEPETEQAGGA